MPTAAPRALHGLRGGAMPGLGLSTDAMDKFMTPEMIRGAANMMSNMDPNVLNSMMSMTGMPADMGFDPAEAKRAADKLCTMSTDEILAMKNGAVCAPVSGGPMPDSVEELVRRAESLKQEGNELHINKEYDAAVAKYVMAKAHLATQVAWPKAASLTRSCSLNEASCQMQLENWKQVKDICSSVLTTDGRNLKALYRRGLAYKRMAENIKTEGSAACEAEDVDKDAAGAGEESGKSRAMSLLKFAYKDLGAASTLDQSDDVVNESLRDLKDAMESVGLDWANIPLDIPPPQAFNTAAGWGTGQWRGGLGGMSPVDAKNVALAQAVWKNTSAVREGASILSKLDSQLVVDLLRSSQADGKVTAEEADAALRMLQHMDDSKLKEQVDALSARTEAPPISLSDLPKMEGNDPFASLFGGLGGMGGMGGMGAWTNGMADPFASMFGSLGGAGGAGMGAGGAMPGMPGMPGLGGLGAGNPFGGSGVANPFGAMGANPFGGAAGGTDPFSSLLGGGNSQMGTVMESVKELWTLAIWIRGAYLRLRKVFPFLTIGFIQKGMTARWLMKRYVLPKYGGTYSSTVTALYPHLERGGKYILGGHAWSAVREGGESVMLAVQELQSPGGANGGRLSTVLAVVAALLAREMLGFLVSVVREPVYKA